MSSEPLTHHQGTPTSKDTEGQALPSSSAPARRAQASRQQLPHAHSVTGAWRVFKTRSNFLLEAVDKSAQQLDSTSPFRDPTASGLLSNVLFFAPDRREEVGLSIPLFPLSKFRLRTDTTS